MEYEPQNWFWIVAGDETRVYSSKAGAYLPATDLAYQAWLAAGGVPTRIASDAELGEVLAQYSLRPSDPAILDGYRETHARKLTLETVAKVLLSHENRIRALEGKSAITGAQFKATVKEMM